MQPHEDALTVSTLSEPCLKPLLHVSCNRLAVTSRLISFRTTSSALLRTEKFPDERLTWMQRVPFHMRAHDASPVSCGPYDKVKMAGAFQSQDPAGQANLPK